MGADRDRQNLLDGRTVILGFRLDALESHVTADHDQPATCPDIIMNSLKPVGQRLEPDEGIGMEEERVGANVAEEHDVVGGKRLRRMREVASGHMGGLVVDLPAAGLERRLEPLDALGIFSRREAIEALLVDAVHSPRFTGDQDAGLLAHATRVPWWVSDCKRSRRVSAARNAWRVRSTSRAMTTSQFGERPPLKSTTLRP